MTTRDVLVFHAGALAGVLALALVYAALWWRERVRRRRAAEQVAHAWGVMLGLPRLGAESLEAYRVRLTAVIANPPFRGRTSPRAPNAEQWPGRRGQN